VKRQDLKRNVLATGTVTSGIDLNLSFKASGIVRRLPAKVGNTVKEGDILAELDNKSERASLLQAQGALAQARANLQKVLDGASSEDVAVQEAAVRSAEVSLANAEKSLVETTRQQQQLVDNAYKSLLNSTLAAIPSSGNLTSTIPVISGVYTGKEKGVYIVRQESSQFSVTGLESQGNTSINSSVSTPTPLGTKGLYIQFPANLSQVPNSWRIEIPNTQAVDYVTNLNVYNSSLETQRVAISNAENTIESAKSALLQAQASLAAKKAEARPADVAVARAQVTSSQGQVEAAEAMLENTIIRAPAGGTITKVDVKLGELAASGKEIISVQDIANLYVEANISEANIASLKIGQGVEYTFDALGSVRKFTGKVTTIEPASTVVSGVVNYTVTSSVDNFTEVRPGMTANMSVMVATRSNALYVPARAIVEKENASFVRVVTDEEMGTYKEVAVSTGLEADGGLVEILSGVTEGQKVVTLIEKK
jgi:HlyD family secretion protein